MSVFVDVVNAIIDQTDVIVKFFTDTIYTFAVDFSKWFSKKCYVLWFETQLFVMKVGYEISSEIFTGLNLSSSLGAAYASIDIRLAQVLNFFRIPEALNILLSAFTTKFIFNFLFRN